MSFVIGIDVGGTFTDAFAASESGRVASAKSLSSPNDFSIGVLNSLEELASNLDLSIEDLLDQTDYIVHGTTSSLNSLVTGEVAKVGFITTRGHADSISIMNVEGRYAGLSLEDVQDMAKTKKPAPLVPRDLICEVDERIDYKGSVVVRLQDEEVRSAVRYLLEKEVEAIAVSLLWSFRNPSHEQRLREIVKEESPDLFVALSSEISPRIREYSRNVTTIMNTQVGPRLKAYLIPLEIKLRNLGFKNALLIMQGSGGCVAASKAPDQAIDTIGSVLTGGIIGCQHLGSVLGQQNIISTDMGGTTFLVGLIVDGIPATRTSTIINQFTVNMPMVDVHTIGAGGGAIAWLDAGGNLRVGPRSAGASPGPACYGAGGVEPTVTDADLVLGIVNPDYFLGGRKTLSVELAEMSIREYIAEPLGLSVDDAAAAIYAIQNAQTTDLVRKVVVDSGYDPRDFVLYAYGGAAPMHCASYGMDLGVKEIVIPLGSTAAVFSAYGLSASDIVLTAEKSEPANMPISADDATETFSSLEDQLSERLLAQGFELKEVNFEREADLRFTMQLAEVTTTVPTGRLSTNDIEMLEKTFSENYESRYGKGSGFADAGIQIITYRVRAVGRLPIQPKLPELDKVRGQPKPKSIRKVFLDVKNRWEQTPIFDYSELGVDDALAGPAIIEAPTTTVALPAGHVAKVDKLGNLVVTISSGGN